jgi:hypothetical protein
MLTKASVAVLLALLPLSGALAGQAESRALSLLKNRQYRLALGGQEVRLRNGVFQTGGSPDDYRKVVFHTAAFGDLNRDGRADAAVILVHTSMGSGAFYELAILTMEHGRFVQRRSVLLGDRVVIKSLRVRAGAAQVVMLSHKQSDPSCCPTQPTTRRYPLRGNASKQSP